MESKQQPHKIKLLKSLKNVVFCESTNGTAVNKISKSAFPSDPRQIAPRKTLRLKYNYDKSLGSIVTNKLVVTA